MTLQETREVMKALSTAYPRFYAGLDEERQKNAAMMWMAAFKSDDVRLVVAAVWSFIGTDEKGFPPVPGQILAKMRLITSHGELSAEDAWNMVRVALRDSLYGAQEQFDKLPESVKGIVGNAEQLVKWAEMDSETVHSVVSSNFLKAYRTESARRKEYAALPPDVRELVDKLSVAKTMPELGTGKGE